LKAAGKFLKICEKPPYVKPANRFYEFGPFRVTRKTLLLRVGALVPLTPKAFDILLALLARQAKC
jgi:DNA-binding winged helix-turn-helix (wHTH) protein